MDLKKMWMIIIKKKKDLVIKKNKINQIYMNL